MRRHGRIAHPRLRAARDPASGRITGPRCAPSPTVRAPCAFPASTGPAPPFAGPAPSASPASPAGPALSSASPTDLASPAPSSANPTDLASPAPSPVASILIGVLTARILSLY